MLTFKEEPLNDVIEEIPTLLKCHYEEVALDRNAIPLDPDWNQYCKLDELGFLSIVTAREGRELVGYYAAFVMPHMHYKASLTAACDLFYLKPEYRKGRNPLRLFQAHEKAMKARGVQRIYTMHKLHVNNIGNMLTKLLGYRHIENVYTKVLEA